MLNFSKHKNTISKLKVGLFTCFISTLCLIGCENFEFEENFQGREISDAEIPSLEVSIGNSSEFNLSKGIQSQIDFEMSTEEATTSVEIYASLNDPEAPASFITTAVRLPKKEIITIRMIENAFDLERSDLAPGDEFFFTFKLIAEDESFVYADKTLSATVNCISEISSPEDTWIGIGSNEIGDGLPANSSSDSIKIIPLENDRYLISDISAGWYRDIGFGTRQEGIYQDDCNEIIWVEPGDIRQFNFVNPETPGEWDPSSETLTIHWSDPDNGFEGQSVFEKK